MRLWGRREVLGGLAVAAACGVVSLRASAAPKSAPLSTQRLTARTVVLSGAGTNILVTRGSDGLIVVDGGREEHRAAVLAAIGREFPHVPIAWLFDTHWHREQTGLNEWVARHGGVVCAHENTRLWLATEYYVDWQDRTYEPLPRSAWPTRTFYGAREQASVGGRALTFGHLANPHTDGDLYVHLADEDILAVGGALTPGAWPLMDYATGGWLGGVVEASRFLLGIATPQTRVVASDGPVAGRQALEEQFALATTMRERISTQIKLGKSVKDMLDEGLTRDYDGRYGDPAFFLRSSYRGLWGHIRELGIA